MSKPTLCALCAFIVLSGCASPPEAEELPDDEGVIERTVAVPPPASPEKPNPGDREEAPTDPYDLLPFTALKVRDVRGGQLTIELPAPPDAVAEMLLDFTAADGHRAWARRHELLSSDDGEVVARWQMEGKSGVEPTVELAFRREIRADGSIRIRFRLSKTDFGLAAFFGDYRISATEAGSRVIQRVFIDSGLWIANASTDDIEAGLREDSKLLREWLATRAPAQNDEVLNGTQP